MQCFQVSFGLECAIRYGGEAPVGVVLVTKTPALNLVRKT